MNYLSYYTKYIAQLLSIGVVKTVVFHPKVTPDHVLGMKGGQRYLIAANHRHALDPFYIACSFRWRDLVYMLPFAVMTANRFYDPWWLRVPAWLAGCFPAHGPYRLHGVDGAVQLLEKGYTVLIFPEGKRIRSGQGAAKPGVSRILEAAPNAKLLLLHIEWQKPPRHASIGLRHIAHIHNDPQTILDHIYET